MKIIIETRMSTPLKQRVILVQGPSIHVEELLIKVQSKTERRDGRTEQLINTMAGASRCE